MYEKCKNLKKIYKNQQLNIQQLQQFLGYTFNNTKILKEALSVDTKEFQRLEFLGDVSIEFYV